MGSFMPLPFGNRERSPRQLFSAETTRSRVAILDSALRQIDVALQQGQFPGMSFDEQAPAVAQVAPQVYPTTEVAAGATAMQTVEVPEQIAPAESDIFFAQSPEAFVLTQTVEMQ
ncbi:MAG TPA: hypothetical protein VJ843_03695 [Candidatus Saccharimonadales bacterium]|nr:hypothetical protein [Candidatus Saccharimonadales bacterium]